MTQIKKFYDFSRTNEGFWDWLTGKRVEGEAKKKGEQSLGVEVEEFYKSLEELSKEDKPIKAESGKVYTYSKAVENIQVALLALGYELPKFGADGYFGPETADAIQKFNDDTAKPAKVDA